MGPYGAPMPVLGRQAALLALAVALVAAAAYQLLLAHLETEVDPELGWHVGLLRGLTDDAAMPRPAPGSAR